MSQPIARGARLVMTAVMAAGFMAGCAADDETRQPPWYPHFVPPANVADPGWRETMPIGQLQSHAGPVQLAGEVTRIGADRIMLDDGTGEAVIYIGPAWDQRHDIALGTRLTVFGIQEYKRFWARQLRIEGGDWVPATPYR